MDSVPNGGWLDGCLNVLAGVEILRRINAQYRGQPPVTVRLVDWADEEGARFGKSLVRLVRLLRQSRTWTKRAASRTRTASRLPDALKEVGMDFERVKESGAGTEKRRRVPGIAHRAGPGAAGPGFAARRGARHVRRRAACHHLSRAGGAFRQHADEPPQRRLPRRRAK